MKEAVCHVVEKGKGDTDAPKSGASVVVIIPYFKKAFFEETLRSLDAQTSRDFEVFVGDDCSPEDPSEVIAKYRKRLRLTYHRFPENMGRHSVVEHWNRCVAMTTAQWIWLFSDDDVAGPDCIAAFQNAVAAVGQESDIYRFNCSVIDIDGKVTRVTDECPKTESAQEIILARLLNWREFFIQSHLFNRAAFEREGGLVPLPTGLFSEDASFSRFARLTGVRTISCGRVFWRESTINLNARRPELVGKKISAFIRHIEGAKQEFGANDKRFRTALRQGAAHWIAAFGGQFGGSPTIAKRVLFYLWYITFDPKKAPWVIRRLRGSWKRRRLGL